MLKRFLVVDYFVFFDIYNKTIKQTSKFSY